MGLTFTVANPEDVFTEAYAQKVKSVLTNVFGNKNEIVLDSDEDPYHSEEVGWSGWEMLQERASEAVGKANIEALLSMEAWSGCFIPCDTAPRTLTINGEETPLSIASLSKLIDELEKIGTALSIKTDNDALTSLAESYLEDDDLVDEDMDIQTFAQLLLAAREAKHRGQPLWIVK